MLAVLAAIAVAGAGGTDVSPAQPASPPIAASPPSASDVEPSIAPVVAPAPPAALPAPEETAAAIRDAFQAAQSQQGPLDGRWRLSDASDGRPLLILQFSDPGGAAVDADATPVEGAWRDPNRTGATDGSGFLDEVDRHGDGLSIRLHEHDGDAPVVITLHTADGEWRGDLAERGSRQHVVMDPF